MEARMWLATGHARSSQARHRSKEAWLEISTVLNSDGSGCNKEWQQWNKYWKDKKGAIKRKISAIHVARQQAGGGSEEIPLLSDMEERILNIMGGEQFAIGDRHLETEDFAVDHIAEDITSTPEIILEGASKERQEMRRTGGGPPPAPPSGSSSDATDWLREIIPSSIDGNMAIYDDDVIYQKPTVFPAKKMEKINEVVEDNTTQESLLPKKPRPEIITMEVVEDYMTEDAHLLNKDESKPTSPGSSWPILDESDSLPSHNSNGLRIRHPAEMSSPAHQRPGYRHYLQSPAASIRRQRYLQPSSATIPRRRLQRRSPPTQRSSEMASLIERFIAIEERRTETELVSARAHEAYAQGQQAMANAITQLSLAWSEHAQAIRSIAERMEPTNDV